MEVSQECVAYSNSRKFSWSFALFYTHFSDIRPIKMYDADVALPLVVSQRANSGEIDLFCGMN